MSAQDSLPSDELLADMRRKYLHAKSMGGDPSWLKGEPITAQILERWIPQVEALQRRNAISDRELMDCLADWLQVFGSTNELSLRTRSIIRRIEGNV